MRGRGIFSNMVLGYRDPSYLWDTSHWLANLYFGTSFFLASQRDYWRVRSMKVEIHVQYGFDSFVPVLESSRTKAK